MESSIESDVTPELDIQSENSREVIGLLLTQQDGTCELQDENVDLDDKTSPVHQLTTDDMEPHPLSIATVTLADGQQQQIVLHQTRVIQMQDGTNAIIPIDDHTLQNAKFIDGQTIQLEDGSTAFLPCKDSSVAYITSSDGSSVFADSSGLSCLYTEAPLDVKEKVRRSENNKTSSPRALALGDKAYRCLYEGCDRLYTTQHHLKVHERSHTGDRPFRCEEPGCGKTFATGYGLKSHIRVHTGEKPYKCPDESCDKAFKTSGDLQKHIRIHTGDRPFKCPIPGCERSFTTSNIRKVHIRTHTGERPYTCMEQGCGKAFASATNYKNHIRIHTGEKPYVCSAPACGKRFTEYSSLYKHHVVHTHAKPYACNICSKTYRQTSTLAMHRRTAHGIVDGNEEGNVGSGEEEEEDSEPTAKLPKLELSHTGVANFVIQGTNQPVMLTNAVVPVSITDSSGSGSTVSTLSGLTLGLTGNNQIVVVADPAQLAALQQLAQQQAQQQANSIVDSELVDEASAQIEDTEPSSPDTSMENYASTV